VQYLTTPDISIIITHIFCHFNFTLWKKQPKIIYAFFCIWEDLFQIVIRRQYALSCTDCWHKYFKILLLLTKVSTGAARVSFWCTIPVLRLHIIDISWVDWAYKSSTCDVMYCRQRRHLYYGGEIKKYYLPPSPATLPS
jgi:hypothetical protein